MILLLVLEQQHHALSIWVLVLYYVPFSSTPLVLFPKLLPIFLRQSYVAQDGPKVAIFLP